MIIYNSREIPSKYLKKDELIIELINCADMALYKSKDNGRNQTHVYSDAGFIEKCDYK